MDKTYNKNGAYSDTLSKLLDSTVDEKVSCISKEKSKTAIELACAEVIDYSRKNLARGLQNESPQQSVHRKDYRQQGRTKRREEL